MASTLTSDGELAYVSFAITKSERTEDGDLLVWGKASDGSVDSDEQIVDPSWMEKAVQDWLASGANVRVQHNSQRDPAGIGVEATTDGDGATWVKSLVVEPVAKTLVEKGALRAYSVGIARPKIVRDAVARGGRIVDGSLVELSLVDRPANKNCGIQLVKSSADGSPEWVGKVWGIEDTPPEDELVNVDLPKNASVSFSPADLAKLMNVKKNLEADVEKRKMDPDVGGGVDRDKIPAADFAGRNRSFPIVTPGDVSDAASSIGRAGSGNFSSDQLKENIIRIARRKGPSFVAELPESWKGDMGKAEDSEEIEKAKKPKKDGKAFPGAAKPFGKKDDDSSENSSDADQNDDSDDDNQDADPALDNKAKGKAKKASKGMKQGKKGKPFPGAHEAFTSEHQHDDGSCEMDGSEAKPEATKGMKDCPGCGKGYDADAKVRTCENCGKKLPKADKGAKTIEVSVKGNTVLSASDMDTLVDKIGRRLVQRTLPQSAVRIKSANTNIVKKDKVMCPGCGANVHDKHSFCPECGKSLAKAKPIDKNANKNHDFTCLGCGEDLDKGEKFCPGCGKKNPGYLPEADAKIEANKSKGKKNAKAKVKKGKPVPDAGVVGANVTDVQPVPVHREPDGPFIESLEHDMHIPTDPDAPYIMEMKAAQRIKDVGAPYNLGAIHDLTCPGFHPDHAVKCHPNVRLADLDLSYWAQKAEDAAYGGTFDQAALASQLLHHATTVKSMDQETYFGAAIEAHKSFQDANPGPGSFPTPTELKPGSFNRPFIQTGHASPGTEYHGPNAHAVPTGDISAEDYTRGYITGGHAADSPSNKTSAILPAPVPTGSMQRTFYTNVQRDSARSAMAAMHDHIAQTFPDLCPMSGHAGPGMEGSAPVGQRPVPTPVGSSKSAKNKGKRVKAVAKSAESKTVKKSKKTDVQPVTKAATLDPEVIKSAVTEATGGLLEKLTDLETALKSERKRNKKLAQAVDSLGNMADPNVTAYRATSIAPPIVKNASPAGWSSVAETAERTQAALMQALQQDARTNPDPDVRERAWAKLYQMSGIN